LVLAQDVVVREAADISMEGPKSSAVVREQDDEEQRRRSTGGERGREGFTSRRSNALSALIRMAGGSMVISCMLC